MKDVTSKSIQISYRKEWKRFIETGEIDEDIIRPVIADSWRRCKLFNLDPYKPISERCLTHIEVENLIESHKEFIGVAWPFMELLYDVVEGSGFRVDLVDEKGNFLKMIGDLEAIENSKKINSLIGANRSERIGGTNSTGVVLETKKPVQTIGAEHYFESFHSYTCSAAPIFNQKEELIGVINMSAHIDLANNHTFGLVIAAAEAIQNEMRIRKINKELHTTLEAIDDGIVHINTNNIITYANSMAANMLGIKIDNMIDRSYDTIFTTSMPIHDILINGKGFYNHEMAVSTNNKDFRCIVSATPIISFEDNLIGMVVVFKKTSVISGLAQDLVGVSARFTFEDIISKSPNMNHCIELGKLASKVNSRILIEGESGTGKEMLAQAIHNASISRKGSFVAVNCGAIPHNLIESEMFGYEEGAFTGARRGGKPGKFELAEGGTLFLDEIGDMPLDIQVKILRVLQENQVVRVGGKKPIPINVRIISATNKNLFNEIKKNRFREDLYYRLNVIKIILPPLRNRCEDIPLLINNIVEKVCCRIGVPTKNIKSNVVKTMSKYNWPGNIRQLENIIESIIVTNKGNEITENSLPDYFGEKTYSEDILTTSTFDKLLTLEEIEEIAIRKTLKNVDGNITEAAKILGVTRRTIYLKNKKYSIF
ncbi:MAG TPA: sigma-54-dependent Fis family transcriptional regulator [Anaerovoracaceae bacterium]|nr:sigma-54-dependent Fis family transcriptional regulator [Anaerovoracaceae bacterium]